MQRYARILVIICIFLCLTLNYTFPLHRGSLGICPFGTKHYANNNECEAIHRHEYNAQQLSKKSTLSTDKKPKKSSLENKENDASNNIEKNIIKDMDLRQYEQLVIMKKYPYLDIKELEMKYRPSLKSIRQSSQLDSGLNIENDPSICEQGDTLNVEVSNRGLSGFAIPAQSGKLSQNTQNSLISGDKSNANNIDKYNFESVKQKVLEYLHSRNNL